MADMGDLGGVAMALAGPFYLHHHLVGDHVGVGEHAPARDDDTRT
jgi:hypothetical protein